MARNRTFILRTRCVQTAVGFRVPAALRVRTRAHWSRMSSLRESIVTAPRVLPVVGTRSRRVLVPDWPGRGRPTALVAQDDLPAARRWIAWRLLAGNGWEIARSAEVFPDRATCRSAVVDLTNAIDRADWTVTRGVRPDAWCWEMTLDGACVAVASRFYRLQSECESALRLFVSVLPVALLPRDWLNSTSTSAGGSERR